MVTYVGALAAIDGEPGQVRKGAATTVNSGARCCWHKSSPILSNKQNYFLLGCL